MAYVTLEGLERREGEENQVVIFYLSFQKTDILRKGQKRASNQVLKEENRDEEGSKTTQVLTSHVWYPEDPYVVERAGKQNQGSRAVCPGGTVRNRESDP